MLRQGLAWGVGHTLMLFGGAVFVMGQAISPNLEQALETAVGIMLIVLGADVLRRLFRDRVRFHVHRHDRATEHVHAHGHRKCCRRRRLVLALPHSVDGWASPVMVGHSSHIGNWLPR